MILGAVILQTETDELRINKRNSNQQPTEIWH